MSISPFFNFSRSMPFCFFVRLLTSNPQRIPNGSNILLKLFMCCVASIVVGAITATWYPLFTALYAAIIATTVLPEPTSPCKSLFIGFSDSMSLSISSRTLSWAFVSLNGNVFITSDICTSLLYFMPLISLSYCSFKLNKASWNVSNSSNTNLFLALAKFSILLGKWISLTAWSSSIKW